MDMLLIDTSEAQKKELREGKALEAARLDPALPAIPPGEVKRFKVDVYEHVTKVAEELAPTGREHLLRALEDVAVDSVAAGARLALAAPVLLRVRTPLAS